MKMQFENGKEKEYEILEMAELPNAVGDQSYGYPFEVECILPAEELKAQEGERQPMRVIFDEKEGYEEAVTSWLKAVCDGTKNSLAYKTKGDYLEEFGKMRQMYSIAGGALQSDSGDDRNPQFCQCNHDFNLVQKTGVCNDGIDWDDCGTAKTDPVGRRTVLCSNHDFAQRVTWQHCQLWCRKSCDCSDVDVPISVYPDTDLAEYFILASDHLAGAGNLLSQDAEGNCGRKASGRGKLSLKKS